MGKARKSSVDFRARLYRTTFYSERAALKTFKGAAAITHVPKNFQELERFGARITHYTAKKGAGKR